ncbi:MAG: excinuclease ABC subunit UvrC [Candidatus Dormibacteria bacterium]
MPDTEVLLKRPEMLRQRLREVPISPGVYVMRDQRTKVIYVGKALNLRNRVRSYFQPGAAHEHRIQQMVERVFDFDILTCSTNQEALLLECNLIKRYRPRYNIRLRDDKNYLYMKVPRQGDFPRIYTVRRVSDDGARYFGPYTNAKALRSTMKTLRRIFPYRTCSDDTFKQARVCLDFHIKRCAGPCEDLVTSAGYHQNLDQISAFMEGRADELVRHLRRDMQVAAAGLDYEQAARLRDRAIAVEVVAERQRVLSAAGREEDVIALAQGASGAVAAVLTVRHGQVLGTEYFELEGTSEMGQAEVINGFVGQFYADATSYPRNVLVPVELADATILGEWLTQRRGARVEFLVPQRGRGRRLVEMAERNAQETLRQAAVKRDYDTERTEALMADLQEALGLDRIPRRIECYDISNTMGTNPVGSMVVFEDGRPRNNHYRRFHIKGVGGANDFAMMQEMLRRRFGRMAALQQAAERDGSDEDPMTQPSTRPADGSFGSVPDLVIVDGGRGQLSAARAVMEELGVHQLATFGLAKQKEELYRPGSSRSIMLPLDSQALFLLQRIRDEAHRFAITFHRDTRQKRALESPLNAVPGLGPVRRKALIKRFRSLEGIRAATIEDLGQVVPAGVAEAIKEHL